MTGVPTIHWRSAWLHGSPVRIVTYTGVSDTQRTEIEAVADQEGFERVWTPPQFREVDDDFLETVRGNGLDVDFGREGEEAPLDIRRLFLTPETRKRLDGTDSFSLWELAGYRPVQGEGQFDGLFFYFRAREAYWRFECGGNASLTRGPRWWHEEEWPGETGFEAGYMSDDDAVNCILKAVETHRTSDRSRFEPGHPDFERTALDGWAMGALSLRRAIDRLGITGEEAIELARAYGVAIPYRAHRELAALEDAPPTIIGRDAETGVWVDLQDEDDF